MMAWMNMVREYVASREDEGQGMVEYGLIIALVALMAIGGLTLLGGSVNDLLSGISF